MDALTLRKSIKERKPAYIRQDHHKRKEVQSRWRAARGVHPKTRLHKKGRQRAPEVGYGSPAAARFMTKHGLMEHLVHSVPELETVDRKTECAVIASTVGMKKRMAIARKAEELSIMVSNIKKGFLEDAKKKFEEKKAEKKESEKKKEAKKPAKKEEKKKTIEEQLTEEDKRKAEKAEKDKMLTRREE